MASQRQQTAEKHYREALGHTLLTADDEVAYAKRIEAGCLARHVLDTRVNALGDADGDLPGGASVEELEWLAADGDRAREEFVTSNLKLALTTARSFRHRGLSTDDVVQQAYEGLVKAVDRFDWTKGFKFSTFAVWWIREALHTGLQDAEFVHYSEQLHNHILKVRAVKSRMAEELGHQPSAAELAEATGLTEVEVARALKEDRTILSLESPWNETSTLAEVIEDEYAHDVYLSVESQIDDALRTTQVREAMSRLPESESEVLAALYGFDGRPPRSVHALTKEFRMTRLTINSRRDSGLAHLREASGELLAAFA